MMREWRSARASDAGVKLRTTDFGNFFQGGPGGALHIRYVLGKRKNANVVAVRGVGLRPFIDREDVLQLKTLILGTARNFIHVGELRRLWHVEPSASDI